MNPNERRNNEDLIRAVTSAVRCELAALSLSAETHEEHHEFVRAWIDKQRVKTERWEAIKTQVGGWAVICFLGALGTSAYMAFKYFLEHNK